MTRTCLKSTCRIAQAGGVGDLAMASRENQEIDQTPRHGVRAMWHERFLSVSLNVTDRRGEYLGDRGRREGLRPLLMRI
jgi:hypothetical protein